MGRWGIFLPNHFTEASKEIHTWKILLWLYSNNQIIHTKQPRESSRWNNFPQLFTLFLVIKENILSHLSNYNCLLVTITILLTYIYSFSDQFLYNQHPKFFVLMVHCKSIRKIMLSKATINDKHAIPLFCCCFWWRVAVLYYLNIQAIDLNSTQSYDFFLYTNEQMSKNRKYISKFEQEVFCGIKI